MQPEFMKLALKLAEKGKGRVSPNPLVGAVLVKKGKIIGKGFHEKFGKAHAEINALKHAGSKAKGSEVYINLEPCSHFGKTPPCVNALIKAGVKKAFIAMKDPNPKVNGKGIKKLRKAGIKVKVLEGKWEKEAGELNRIFIKWVKTGIPYVVQKIAVTEDGFISWGDLKRKKITGKKADDFVQGLRNELDAVLVGKNTVELDDPELTCRMKGGRNPLRVILDPMLELDLKKKVFAMQSIARFPKAFAKQKAFRRNGKIIVFCCGKANKEKRKALEKIGARVFSVKGNGKELDLKEVLKKLGKLGISSVLVEGGRKLNSAFLKRKLSGEIVFLVGKKKAGKNALFFVDEGVKKLGLKSPSVKRLEGDWLVSGRLA